ncbi:MAG: hypothetical protein AAGJ52_14820, partial [Pseudomonadota bacterium]
MLELIFGGRVESSLWMTALFHTLMVLGIWGAGFSGATQGNKTLLVASAMISLGYLGIIAPP